MHMTYDSYSMFVFSAGKATAEDGRFPTIAAGNFPVEAMQRMINVPSKMIVPFSTSVQTPTMAGKLL